MTIRHANRASMNKKAHLKEISRVLANEIAWYRKTHLQNQQTIQLEAARR
jgi:hypothetical protein